MKVSSDSSASATSATSATTAKSVESEARQLSSDVPKVDFGVFAKQAQTVAQTAINSIKRTLGSTVKGAMCPREFPMIPDGYDYGVGCGLKDLSCSCPSFLDVCATSPRTGKVEDFKDWMIRLSVGQLGYCRTGQGQDSSDKSCLTTGQIESD